MYSIVAQSVCMVHTLILLFSYKKLEDCIKILFSLIIFKTSKKNIFYMKSLFNFFYIFLL
jgi:hypothetical protein